MIINVKNNSGHTPLFYACNMGYLDTIKILVESGADVNIPTDDLETPLMHVAGNGNFPVIEYLIKKGAHLNEQDKDGHTALIIACIAGRKSPNKDYYVKSAKILIEGGANVNICNSEGNTVLHYAIMLGDDSLVEMIIKKSNSMETENIL